MSVLFVGIFLTLLATCPAFQRLESVNRFHYGASFRHHGQLLNDVDTWIHTFEIRLPPLLFPQIPVGPCGNATDFFCTFRSLLLTEFNRLSANISQDVQATFRLIEQMIGREQPPPLSNSRFLSSATSLTLSLTLPQCRTLKSSNNMSTNSIPCN